MATIIEHIDMKLVMLRAEVAHVSDELILLCCSEEIEVRHRVVLKQIEALEKHREEIKKEREELRQFQLDIAVGEVENELNHIKKACERDGAILEKIVDKKILDKVGWKYGNEEGE